MNKRLVVALLKDLLVALVSVSSGCLWSVIGIQYLQDTHFPNFRVMDFVLYAWFHIIGYGWIGLVMYSLGIYSAAWLMRQFYPRREPSFGPSLLVMSGGFGLILGCLLQWTLQKPTTFLVWNAWLWGIVGSVLTIWAACQNKNFIIGRRQLRLRIGVPLLLMLSVFCLTYTGFPGVNATPQVREQWGLKHPSGMYGGVSTFKDCKPMVDRVGKIQFVAPTEGPNFYSSDYGSNHGEGEVTLEVVGSQGKGIANYKHSGWGILTSPGSGNVSFTHQGKTENLSCHS
jgi:hypothetical protein